MKVLMINASPRPESNTQIALDEMRRMFEEESIEVENIRIGRLDIRGCTACGSCVKLGRCVYNDIVNDVAPKFAEADGLVLGTPVYYASPNGTLVSFLDRLFFSTEFDKTMKVGAAVECGRRGGLTTTWDVINKYFAISGMPIASGQYWNGIHGRIPGESEQDAEGLQQMRTLAKNMAFLMKSIALGKDAFGLPNPEEPIHTNFVR